MVSVIIPTLNEEHYLPKLLNSLEKQSYTDFEIIVADANSKDRTRDIAEQHGCRIVDGGLPAFGRNSGAKIAKGKFLLFLDADVIVKKDFIKNVINEMEKNNVDVATCRFIPLSNKKIDKILHDIANLSVKIAQHFKPHGAGFCIFSSVNIHKAINGFNEKMSLGEDHDYLQRAAKIGRFCVLEKPKVYVSVRRLNKEGRSTLVKKYIKSTIYQLFGIKISNEMFDYEFGNYISKRKNSHIKKNIAKIKKRINEFNSYFKR